MLKHIRSTISMFLAMTLITGMLYPALVTAIAQLAFPFQAKGSLLQLEGKRIGSRLIGQQFDRPEYFWGRLSATSPMPYNPASSSGSNFGPMSPALVEASQNRIQQLKSFGYNEQPVPVDLVTASGSGLDPHISHAAAEYQLERVAKYRRMSVDSVRALLAKHLESRQFGILGEPRVNVLMLNLELDAANAIPASEQDSSQ